MFKSGSEGRTARQRAVLTRLISPLLLNVALHGLEGAAGVRYLTSGVDAGDVRRDRLPLAGSPLPSPGLFVLAQRP